MDVLGKVFLLSKVAWGQRLRGVHQAGIPGVLRSTRETEGDECFAGDQERAKEQPEMVDLMSRNHNIAGIPPSRFHRWESVNSQALSGLCLEKGYTMEILSRW